jgi:hypothetical protein
MVIFFEMIRILKAVRLSPLPDFFKIVKYFLSKQREDFFKIHAPQLFLKQINENPHNTYASPAQESQRFVRKVRLRKFTFLTLIFCKAKYHNTCYINF